jgi:hypothetical protein
MGEVGHKLVFCCIRIKPLVKIDVLLECDEKLVAKMKKKMIF